MEPLPTDNLVARLGLALAIGLLVGLERGWRERAEPAGSRTAGIRTFAAIGLLGGAFVAAMVLGMVQALGAVYLPDLSAVLPFVIMVAVLIWKPAGFAGSRT